MTDAERQLLEEMRERENELMREMESQESELRSHQIQLNQARREQSSMQAEFATMQAKVRGLQNGGKLSIRLAESFLHAQGRRGWGRSWALGHEHAEFGSTCWNGSVERASATVQPQSVPGHCTGSCSTQSGKQKCLSCQRCASLKLDCCGAFCRRPCKNLDSRGINAGEGTKGDVKGH
jgi:hypothetical protein